MSKGLNGINYKILLYRGPSKLNISNSKEYIDTLPNNNLLDCDENMHYNRKILLISSSSGSSGKNYGSKES